MAKFTTTEPINFLNFDIGDLDDGAPAINTTTQFERQEAGAADREDFFGTGFTYSAGNLTGGTITHITSTDLTGSWDLSSFAMTAATAKGFIDASNAQGFLAAALRRQRLHRRLDRRRHAARLHRQRHHRRPRWRRLAAGRPRQ
jgi:hypothetical protein